jgi:endonuclease/exonuclease/phosphatase family metal-dependent hydrolase
MMLLKVITYNIHKGFNLNNSKLILHELKKLLRTIDADIIFLQEVQGEHDSHKSKFNDYPTESQFEFLADTIWPNYSYGKNAVYPKGHHGNAILSKFPILFNENIDLTLHPREYRGLLHLEVLIPLLDKKIHLFNTHLNLFHHDRIKQLQKIEHYINHLKLTSPFILAGDFNDWHLKLHQELMKCLNINEIFIDLHGQHPATFPNFFPKLSLDRLYYSGLKPLKAKVFYESPWNSLSDHLPLYGEFELKND